MLEPENFCLSSLDGAKIRKHNALIEARYQLPNLQEQRVIFLLLAQIKPSDEDFKSYRIAVADFAKAIEPAVAEVTAKTELNIYAVEYGKTGRAVSRVTFRVEVRELSILDERAALLAVEQQAEKTSKELLCDKLTALGYGAAVARKDVNKYGVKRIERNLAYTLAKQQEGKLSDVPAFLATAIALDYGNQWETQLFEQHEHEAQQRAQEAAQAAAKAKAQQEHRANSKAALTAFYALPAHEQTAVALAFMMQETDLLYQQLFADQMALGEVKDRTLKARLAAFLLKRGKVS